VKRSFLLVPLLVLAACGGGGGTPAPPVVVVPTPTPTPTPSPTPTPTPSATVQPVGGITIDQGYRITGVAATDSVGNVAAGLGDINGDGLADYAVGVTAGAIAVVFGSTAPPGTRSGDKVTLDFNSISPQRGFLVRGTRGIVNGVGDLNGDGLDEIAFGRPTDASGQGDGFVLYGRRGQYGTVVGDQAVVTLPNLSPSDGFVVRGKEGGDAASTAISSAGDVNGDGFGDLLVGAPFGEPAAGSGASGPQNAGDPYIVFGHMGTFGSLVQGRSILFLGALEPGEGVVIHGRNIDARAGSSVAPLGDFNGDGIDDIVLGAPGDTTLFPQAGAAYVIFGTRGSFGPTIEGQATLSVSTLTPAQGLIIGGDQGANTGRAVRGAGDLNGDGLPDLLILAAVADSFGANAFVVFGNTGFIGQTINGRQILNLTTLAPGAGFAIKGASVSVNADRAVSGAGDFNGDGLSDLLFGDALRDDIGMRSGIAYLLRGTNGAFGTLQSGRDTIDLTSLAAGRGLVFKAESAGDQLGFAVAGVGDVNGDGKPDILLGAPADVTGSAGPGSAFVIYGRTL
jgi:hypothetical protein